MRAIGTKYRRQFCYQVLEVKLKWGETLAKNGTARQADTTTAAQQQPITNKKHSPTDRLWDGTTTYLHIGIR